MKKYFSLLSILFLLFTNSYAGIINFNVDNDISKLSFSEIYSYNYISFDNSDNYFEHGEPSLPSVSLFYSLPTTSEIISAEITNENWVLVGKYNIMPTQKSIPFGSEFYFDEFKTNTYTENQLFPEEPIVSFSSGVKSGFIISNIVYCPFKYNPITKELFFLERANVEIKYNEGIEENIYLTETQLKIFKEDIISLVSNPDNVEFNSPLIKENKGHDVEYIIITTSNLLSSFEPLIEWKNQKGIGAEIFSKDWIISNYSGYDNMEKIRSFIQDYHQNHGLVYLVLAGDYDNLGARLVPIRNYNSYDTTPSDLYFSAIAPYSDDWDGNNNHYYGELHVDACDFYSDVYVGRFPVNTTGQADLFVNKLLTYEKSPPTGFIEKGLMAGAGLWPEVNYYGSRVCDSIADNHHPSWWSHTKMYEYDTLVPHPEGFPDSLSQGYGWCNIEGHGNQNGVYWDTPGDAILSRTTAGSLTNGMKLGVIQTIACQPGWFDNYECLAEYIFNSQNGGAIAILMNARFGWGSPPNLGWSERIEIETVTQLFDNELWNIGRAHGLGKDLVIPGINYVKHWCLIELNLFGDPETQIYTREPLALNCNYSPVIHVGSDTFEVVVQTNKAYIEGAVCCLSSADTSIWFKAETDANGLAKIPYNINQAQDEIVLTVYAHNYLPTQDTIILSNTGSYISFIEIDSIYGGHNNSQINGGCLYNISIKVGNFGSVNVTGVKGLLSSSSSYISFNNDTLNFGNINSGDSSTSNFIEIDISDNVPDSTIIPITLICFDDNDSTWESSFSLLVRSPKIEIKYIDGPLYINPGDNINISTMIENIGSGYAYDLDLFCRTNDQYLNILDSFGELSILNPDSQVYLTDLFNIDILSTCPQPYFADLIISIHSSGGYITEDTITFGIGTLFADDFENTDSLWNYTGPSSSWHITANNYHSGSHSMYCGEEGSWTYNNSIINSRVSTKELYVLRGTELTFWHWYDIADNNDKVQIQYSTDLGANWTLIAPEEGYTGVWNYAPYDSIFTGEHKVWQQQHIKLFLEDTVLISWLFFSNSSGNAEGYYFDDVEISLSSGMTGVEEEEESPIISEYSYYLQRAFPNPVVNRTMINYSIGNEEFVSLKIYDISGREISTLINTRQTAGNYRVEWDGRDNIGSLVSSGTYFYRLSAGGFSAGEKLTIVR